MKTIIHKIITLLILVLFILSCKDANSLQQFIVIQQEKQDVISLDIPASMLATQGNIESNVDVETLKSIKKINLLAYQIKDSSKTRYKTDKEHIKTLLSQKKYGELMRFGNGSQGARVYMLGENDAIDEIIVFANDNSLGWALVRVLGKDMQPAKIIQLMQKIDLEESNIDISQFKEILNKKNK